MKPSSHPYHVVLLVLIAVVVLLYSGLLAPTQGRVSAASDPALSVSVGQDANGHYYAILENSQIKVRYGYFQQGNEQGAIVDFILKTAGNEDQAGSSSSSYLDASATRGLMTRASVKYDGDDSKSVWLEWEDGAKIQEVTIFPDSPYIQIDYFRYGVNIVEIGTPGGSGSSGVYEIYGNSCWLDCVTPRGYVMYEQSYYNRYDSTPPYPDPTDAGSLNYNGYFITGIYRGSNSHGFARVMPVPAIKILKLLTGPGSNRGFEWFPYYQDATRPAYRGYMFGFTGGASDVTNLGQPIVDTVIPGQGANPPATYNLTVSSNLPGVGSIAWTPMQALYTQGQVVTLTATASPGYVFTGWTIGSSPNGNNPVAVTMSGNRTVTANFAHIGYAVTTSVVGSGAVTKSPDQAAYPNGSSVMLTALPSPGWTFAGWLGDWSGNANPAMLTVRSNKTVTAVFTQTAIGGWWNNGWTYRVPIQVNPGGTEHYTKPAEVSLNFTTFLTTLGQGGTFDPNSLRVVEVNSQGVVLDQNLDFQFDPASNYNATTNAAGKLIFVLDGTTPASTIRYFHVYFDTTNHGPFIPLTVSPQVTVTTVAGHEGQDSFKIQTEIATYYYHKQGAGFASLDDRDGVDWISYHPTGDSAGRFRGIPNMNDYVHPGSTQGTSTIQSQGPLKTVIYSQVITGTQTWQLTWTMYPRYATMELAQAGTDYWFLYEGTPFGELNKTRDYFVLSDGITRTVGNSFAVTWNGDIAAPEWAYFGDSVVNRALFVAHHEDDNQIDTFWQMQNNMTVFGLGRDGTDACNPCNPLLNQTPAHYTIGLVDSVDMAQSLLTSAFRDVAATAGAPQMIPANQAPVLNPIGNKTVTADQTLSFTVSASDPDGTTPSLSASGLPTGAVFNTGTGQFSWTPTPADVGNHQVTFIASDGSLTDSETITSTVTAVPVTGGHLIFLPLILK